MQITSISSWKRMRGKNGSPKKGSFFKTWDSRSGLASKVNGQSQKTGEKPMPLLGGMRYETCKSDGEISRRGGGATGGVLGVSTETQTSLRRKCA